MNTLAELLSSRVMAEVLRLLFVTEGQELHARDMARQAGLADATVRQELARLSGLAIIEARRAGNRTYYRANPIHPLYRDIRNLVLKTSGLVDVLRGALTDPRVQIAFVFGSMASGTAKASSDVDLMVIGTIHMRELAKLLSGVTTTLGRESNPHILTQAEFEERKKSGDHFLTTVLGSPKLFVIGSEHELESVGR
jgi:DNA-binding transcriptional ArsR family regulator